MLALLLALGAVAGIVKLAYGQQEDPTIRRALERRRLLHLARKRDGRLTLPEAEDGVILAKRHGETLLARRFAKLVLSKRRAAHHPHLRSLP